MPSWPRPPWKPTPRSPRWPVGRLQPNESGRDEVTSSRFQVPANDSVYRAMVASSRARDGSELFYAETDRVVMAVRVQKGERPCNSGGPPSCVNPAARQRTTYDVSPDGRRFIAIQSLNAAAPSLTVVLNWVDDLQKRIVK